MWIELNCISSVSKSSVECCVEYLKNYQSIMENESTEGFCNHKGIQISHDNITIV